VLLTYEKPVVFEFSSGIVFGGNCPLGFIAIGLDDLRVMFPSNPTGAIARGHCNETKRTVTTKYNSRGKLECYWSRK